MSDDNKLLIDTVLKIDARLDSVDKTLVQNTAILDYHIKRTDILEQRVAPLEDNVKLMTTVWIVVRWAVLAASGLITLYVTIRQMKG